MTIILLGICSIGSDTGIKFATHIMLFGFPLTLWYWFNPAETRITLSFNQENQIRQLSMDLSSRSKKYIISFILVIFSLYSIPYIFLNTQRDNGLRWKMNTAVDAPKFFGVLTTRERAQAIESLLVELNKYVKPGDIMLTYESIPLVYFLTETRPYLYNSWPIQYLPSEFDYALGKARTDRSELPVAVLATVEMRSQNWPQSGGLHMDEGSIANRYTLHRFLDAEGYRKIWNNEAFEILVPPSHPQ
jgi:hypothetical protein